MIVHLNGQLVPLDQARVSPLDRGFVFGDGVYEGLRAAEIPVHGSESRTTIVGLALHLDRLRGCLAQVGIDFDADRLGPASYDLLAANSLRDAFIYWQVTRGTPPPGAPPRTRVPKPGMTPTVFGYCAPQPPLSSFLQPPTKSAVTLEDTRWQLGHIKSISLMGNVLLTMEADRRGCEEAIFTRDGLVAEGTATNVLLAFGDRVVTPELNSAPMLRGVTRTLLLAADPGIVERPVRVEELAKATEIMVIGTTTMVTSITKLDGRAVGDGAPGPIARRLLKALLETIRAEAGVTRPTTAAAP